MYEAIKASKISVRWQLREVHKVTQWKDDCVYRTKSLGIICCSPEYADSLRTRNIQVGSVSTRITRLIGE